MEKSRIILIISLVIVFIATMFLWFFKAPFIEEIKDTILHLVQPAEPEPSGETSVPDESGTYDDSVYDEIDESELLKNVLSMINCPLELPVEGSTGWAAIAIALYNEASVEADVVTNFNAGQVFVVIEEQGDWWYVESDDGEAGWVEHIACLINLPDVIPSIVYNITNAYSALTHSSEYEIPGVTGQKLYDAGPVYNPRLLRDEFIVPALYSTSKLLCAAQRFALESGDTIIMHEAYRAHESQQRSVNLLRELMEVNATVNSAIEDGPWSLNWFISTTLSNHQRGVAFDVNLGKVLSHSLVQTGDVAFLQITEYEEHIMPTMIHELSPLAIALSRPVSSRDRDEWRDVPLADTMTPGAVLLQNYFDKAGFTPLASEWWHFNDLEGVEVATELRIVGSFFITNDDMLSFMP